MKKSLNLIGCLLFVVCLVPVLSINEAIADGTEVLGPPSIDVAAGSGVVIAGVGLQDSQPGTININVPGGAVVNQAILYWAGYDSDPCDAGGTMGITVDGNAVEGNKIGGPAFFFLGAYVSAYRADITGLDIVHAGNNSLDIGGLSFNLNHGAGLLVIFDDGFNSSDIQLRDGADTAFINFPDPRRITVEQVFAIAPANEPRVGDLALFASSVAGIDLGGLRPNLIKVTAGAGPPQLFADMLGSNDGLEWDSLMLPINIPAGVSSIKVQLLSEDVNNTGLLPASLVWICGALSVPEEIVCQEEICGHTIGFWKTNAAKILRLNKGRAKIKANSYLRLLSCVEDEYGVSIDDWAEWMIGKPMNRGDIAWALHWLSHAAYVPGSGWENPQASDPQVKARAQFLSLMLTACYRGSDYTDATISVPGHDGWLSVAEWITMVTELYNAGEFMDAHSIAVHLNENCAVIPVECPELD